MSAEIERVVLLDESGDVAGTAPKFEAHHRATPLHLAFSCYVFAPNGDLLVTRRADSKITWPGVWTNSVCGHPSPHEDIRAAVQRRGRDELGIDIADVRPILPAFRYRAVMPNGMVENEICPVFAGVTADVPRPEPEEVAETQWVPWRLFRHDVLNERRVVSPWCVEQIQRLADYDDDPNSWAAEPWHALPPAAHHAG